MYLLLNFSERTTEGADPSFHSWYFLLSSSIHVCIFVYVLPYLQIKMSTHSERQAGSDHAAASLSNTAPFIERSSGMTLL